MIWLVLYAWYSTNNLGDFLCHPVQYVIIRVLIHDKALAIFTVVLMFYSIK